MAIGFEDNCPLLEESALVFSDSKWVADLGTCHDCNKEVFGKDFKDFELKIRTSVSHS